MSKVTIENHNGRLRLRWRYQGKRYTLAISVANNVMGQAIAKQKASQIEVDMQAGYFDLSLLKYKPRILGKTATEVTAPELFERYTRVIAKDKALCNASLERSRGCSAHARWML
jgi:integrase